MIHRVYTSYAWSLWEEHLPDMEKRLQDVWFEKWEDATGAGVVVVIRADPRKMFHLRLKNGTEIIELVLIHLSYLTWEVAQKSSQWETRIVRIEKQEEAEPCPT